METQKLVLFSCFFLFSLLSGATVSAHQHHRNHRRQTKHYLYGFNPTKLFVFGDSYVDTGNIQKSIASSWKYPYGITFPGKPTGRFSDGRVLTDFIAKYLGIKSPIAYKWRNVVGPKGWRIGMNFAYGGTGVFNTVVPQPNMTTQIDIFQKLSNDGVFSWQDRQSSVALVTLAGNDYSNFIARDSSAQGLQAFIPLVVNQLAINLKRVHDLGVKRVAVTSLQPLGCLPRSTFTSSFQVCNTTQNIAVNFHNLLLQQAVAKLNNGTNDSPFVIIDLYSSFMTVIKNKGEHPGSTQFGNPLKPCCVGISSEYFCGSVDANGVKKYTVCDAPQSAFFWDTVHPTQAGWRSVYNALQVSLQQI